MKLQPLTLPAEKARKERKQFAIAALVLSAISLLVFWFLGIAGLALGARALILTNHKDLQKDKDNTRYRVFAILAIVFGAVSVFYGLATQ